LIKNKITYLDDQGTNYMQLISLGDSSSQIQIVTSIKSGIVNLQKGLTNTFANGYSFTLQKINLNKVARVSILSDINNGGTTANFSFNIGIEKRAIDLSPDEIKNLINTLNDSIDKWGKVSDTLGNVTQGLKTACLATGAALVVKNFIEDIKGGGIARQAVMRGIGGWADKCTNLVSQGKYISVDKCFLDNSNQIENDTAQLTNIINQQNTNIQGLEQGSTTTQFLSEKVVDTNSFMAKYAPQVSSYLETSSGFASALNDPNGKGQAIDKTNILTTISNGYSNKIYSSDQLKEIELYSKVLDDPSSSEELQSLAKSRLYSDLSTLQTSAGNFAKASQLASTLSGVSTNQIGFLEMDKNVKAIPYTGLTLGETGKSITASYSYTYAGGMATATTTSSLPSNTPVYIAQASDGNTYLYILDNSAGTSKLTIKKDSNGNQMIYDYNSMTLVSKDKLTSSLTNIYFQKYDSSTYNNKYTNAKLSCYETDPYKGLPSIVPFDLNKGWYAAIKQTLPVGANIQSYDASARVSSFYLCNVGANGIEEFNTVGDDTCEMINTGTGQPYNQFPGLSEGDASSLVTKSIQAIQQASTACTSGATGAVSILGQNIQVGLPALDIPQFECQDFMSEKDCLLLFNLCDPVICPSSRCDLGGAYPVKDVIQSGIIGSIALCLPNAREGIIMPVCLSGVKAGIDGFLSVQKSFRDCLQENLDTGKTVGICDEAYSVYICDFFWKQALPLTEMVIPKIIESLFGQNVRGGGEYLGIANALSTAEKSISYFTNSYGIISGSTFTSKVQELSSEVCKSSISAVLPDGAELVNSLTKPDSPVQFTGRFDETTLTTVTVPPTSHYKVFYHIYAGEDAGAYYQVYLKGVSTSSYYKDTAQSLVIATGYAAVGGYATDTVDKIATSGYKQLCINVNGDEECGFQEVSTDFAANYLKDSYLSNEANQTSIQTTSNCISGTANIYSMLSGINAQAAANSLINPAIYNQGIIRVCATDDPGKGTDPYTGTENSRWKEVGYCDTPQMKCWIDSQSIEDVIKSTTIANATLDSLSTSYDTILANQNGYLTNDQFSSAVDGINSESDNSNKINLVNNIIDKVFLSNQKVQLLYLRGNAYADLLPSLLSAPNIASISSGVSPISGGTNGGNGVSNGGTTTGTLTLGDVSGLSTVRQEILHSADGSIGKNSDAANCWEALYPLYVSTGGVSCIYSDSDGKTYSVGQKSMTTSVNAKTVFQVSGSGCTYYNQPQDAKLSHIQPGDILSYTWTSTDGSLHPHNAIFIKWLYPDQKIAQLFDWNGIVDDKESAPDGTICGKGLPYYSNWKKNYPTPYCKIYRYYQADLSDIAHPVYVIFPPLETGATSMPTSNLPAPQDSGQIIPSTTTELTNTVGYKIYQAAMDIFNLGGSELKDDSFTFVTKSLVKAGVPGIFTADSSNELVSKISGTDYGFSEINTKDIGKGDVVLIGKGCAKQSFIGIVFAISGDQTKADILTNVGTTPDLNNLLNPVALTLKEIPISSLITDDVYIYKTYRYTKDLDSSEVQTLNSNLRMEWTLNNAINQVNALSGTYTQNEIFADQFIFDGLLTQDECNNLRGVGLLNSQKDMTWLGKLLLSKCQKDVACNKQLDLSSVSTSESAGNKIYTHAQAYVDAGSSSTSLDLVIQSLKAAGANEISSGGGATSSILPSTLSELASTLANNPNAFYPIDISQTQRGDIVFIRDGCQILNNVGIVGIPNSDSGYINLISNLGNKVTINSLIIPDDVLVMHSRVVVFNHGYTFPYQAYRYVGDLSDSDKNKISKQIPWTISSALKSINENKLSGSYSSNRVFMYQLVLDGVLTKDECLTMINGYVGGVVGTGQKDISWLQGILSSKVGSSSITSNPTSSPTASTSTTSNFQSLTTAQKIYTQAQAFVNLQENSLGLVTQSLSAAGITDVSGSDYGSLASSLQASTNFYQVSISKTQPGDIVLIRKGCQLLYSVGIVGTGSSDVTHINVYSNLGNKVTISQLEIPNDVFTGVYPYEAYRYVGDLSITDKTGIKVTPWTATTALKDITSNNLGGSYKSNLAFMYQLVLDGVLTSDECNTMIGTSTLGIFQKDILWLKQELLNKLGVSGGAH
jgi:hypothetical protein